jgi:hypothetical protein
MEFGGHVITLSLVVARSIAIKSITTLKIKRKNHVIVYRDSNIWIINSICSSSSHQYLENWRGNNYPIYASVAFAILFLALNP